MIFDITKKQAVLAISIDVVAHSLSVIKFTVCKAALFVANITGSDLLDELVCISVKHQESIVRRISYNEKLRDSIVW